MSILVDVITRDLFRNIAIGCTIVAVQGAYLAWRQWRKPEPPSA